MGGSLPPKGFFEFIVKVMAVVVPATIIGLAAAIRIYLG
jgi:hypothetical protein